MTGNVMGTPSRFDLSNHGLTNLNMTYWTLPSPALVERIVQRGEGVLAHLGAVVVRTGHHTGRSPNDKFVVREPSTEEQIWWGNVNRPMSPEHFDRLQRDTNGEIRFALNSTLLPPGDYSIRVEGFTWRGETTPLGTIAMTVAR